MMFRDKEILRRAFMAGAIVAEQVGTLWMRRSITGYRSRRYLPQSF